MGDDKPPTDKADELLMPLYLNEELEVFDNLEKGEARCWTF